MHCQNLIRCLQQSGQILIHNLLILIFFNLFPCCCFFPLKFISLKFTKRNESLTFKPFCNHRICISLIQISTLQLLSPALHEKLSIFTGNPNARSAHPHSHSLSFSFTKYVGERERSHPECNKLHRFPLTIRLWKCQILCYQCEL